MMHQVKQQPDCINGCDCYVSSTKYNRFISVHAIFTCRISIRYQATEYSLQDVILLWRSECKRNITNITWTCWDIELITWIWTRSAWKTARNYSGIIWFFYSILYHWQWLSLISSRYRWTERWQFTLWDNINCTKACSTLSDSRWQVASFKFPAGVYSPQLCKNNIQSRDNLSTL